MNIQVYQYKKNFEVQKALRFFKERGVKIQIVDLKKHRLGARELSFFAERAGAKVLIDFNNPRVKEHPIAYTTDRDIILDYLIERPEFLMTPLIRDGQKTMVGFDEGKLAEWIAEL